MNNGLIFLENSKVPYFQRLKISQGDITVINFKFITQILGMEEVLLLLNFIKIMNCMTWEPKEVGSHLIQGVEMVD